MDSVPPSARASKRRRHIVLLAYHFPPDPAVGALRPARVARELANAGYRVTVIAAPLPGGSVEAETVDDPAISIRRVALQPGLRDLQHRIGSAFRRLRRTSPTPATEASSATWLPPSGVAPWRRNLLSLLWLPDDRQGFIMPAVRAGFSEIRAGADLIYSTAPPFSAHVAGLLLKLWSGASWIAEFRDPWTDNPGKPAFVRSRFSDTSERWLERRVLRAADLIVAVTRSTRDLLANKLQADEADRVIVSMNGIGAVRQERNGAAPREGPIRILYTGNLYLERNPTGFLRALGHARARMHFTPDDVRLDFVGDCQHFLGRPVRAIAEECGVADLTHFTAWASPDDCRKLQENADLLLLLATGQPAQVPNKLFEYLGSRKPILAFLDDRGDSAGMLREVEGHHVITEKDSPAERDAIVAEAIRLARVSPTRGNAAVLEQWATTLQMRRLLDAVAGVR